MASIGWLVWRNLTRAALCTLLISCTPMPARQDDGFHVEPEFRFTILPGMDLPQGAVLHVRLEHLTSDQVFMINRCGGDPCNTAKVVSSAQGSEDALDELTYKIVEPGAYYLWVQKKLSSGEQGPVKIKSFTGGRLAFEATLESGTKLVGDLNLASRCSTDDCRARSTLLPGIGDTTGGAATYSLSFPVPEGEKSMQPDVSLSYSSRSGNGLLGVGWTLSAGSSIFRCPTIWETEGYSAAVHYDNLDHLCLDGEFLVPIRGKSGADGSIYGLEVDSGLAVGLSGNLDDPKSYFFTLDGQHRARQYGKRYIPIGAKAPLSWLLTTKSNPDGLFVRYSYIDIDGETALSEIRYTGKVSDDATVYTEGNKFVRFEYANRPDSYTSFLSGGESRGSVVLVSARSGVLLPDEKEDVRFEYQFSYHQSPSTDRLLLDSVTGCSYDEGKKTCSTPTTVEWHEAPLAFSEPRHIDADASGVAIAPHWHSGDALPALSAFTVVGDFDADGRKELLARAYDGSATVFFVGMDLHVIHRVPLAGVLDLGGSLPANGCFEIRSDGACDLVGGNAGRISAMAWRGTAFGAPEQTAIAHTGDLVVVDADGDGQRDLITGSIRDGRYEVTLYTNTGSSDKQLAFSAGRLLAKFAPAPQMHIQADTAFFDGGNTILVRSGARIEHILHIQSSPTGIARADAINPREFGISDAAQKSGIYLADINGDGLTDVVYVDKHTGTWQVQINKGGGLAPPQETGHRDDRQSPQSRVGTLVFDVNADGMQELVFPARRLTEYCVTNEPQPPVCSDELGRIEPRMDLGIYEFEAIRFAVDPEGRYVPQRLAGFQLVGQANRASAGQLFGDDHYGLISPFDRGVENGRFRSGDGELSECPARFGCGVQVSAPAHTTRVDRQNPARDVVSRIVRGPNDSSTWNLYPISSAARGLYRVPPLGSVDRYIEPGRYYFTSSMLAVGEEMDLVAGHTTTYRYDYGGGVYDAQGRGFQGYKWIVVHDPARNVKYGNWWRQAMPFTGVREWNWSETETDDENDYLHGSPGRDYLSLEKTELHCYGPPASAISARAGCQFSSDPLFQIVQGPFPGAAK